MAFEENVKILILIIFGIAIIAVMIGFWIFFRPQVEGGWLGFLFNALREIIKITSV